MKEDFVKMIIKLEDGRTLIYYDFQMIQKDKPAIAQKGRKSYV